jgi:hypothetical protein
MIIPEENRPNRRKTCSRAILSTKNLKRTGLGLKPGLRGDRAAINRVSDGTDPFGIQTPMENLHARLILQ